MSEATFQRLWFLILLGILIAFVINFDPGEYLEAFFEGIKAISR